MRVHPPIGEPAAPAFPVTVLPLGDHAAVVVSNNREAAEYWCLSLSVAGPALQAIAGQFFQILCPVRAPEFPYLRRPMSIYRVDADAGLVEFLYKVTGSGTRSLASLERGAAVQILGPLGVGFRIDRSWQNIVVVGRGVGLATLAPLAELAARAGLGLTAIISARSKAHVICADRFSAAGATVTTVLDSDGSSEPGHVEDILRGLLQTRRADAFFTCGSNRLLTLLQRLARECDIRGQVAIEQQMACGLGMCFSCVRAFSVGDRLVSKRVCWDGPVFDLRETVAW